MSNTRQERNKSLIEALEKKIEILQKEELTEDILLEIEDCKQEILNLSKDFKTLVEETKQDIRDLYLNDEEGDWSVAWSGGKDSTTVAGLVVDMLLELDESQWKRNIHFVMSDTMVENPNLDIYMRSQVDKLSKYVKDKGLPITVSLVHRPVEQGYFFLILGRGYFLPLNNGQGRWCTGRLKLNPQNEWLKEIKPIYQLTGVRLSESAKRKASIEKWTIDSRISKKVGGTEKHRTFMAIVDFTIEDVWEYLQRERLAWSSTHDVRTLYKEATGECGFTNPKGVESKVSQLESCGARFGCWVCPVVMKDKSTEAMSQHNEWMKPLTAYRLMQFKVMGAYVPKKKEGQSRKERSVDLVKIEEINKKIKSITKSGYKRNGKPMMRNGERDTLSGTTTIEARKWLFNKLIETQELMNNGRVEKGLFPIELIAQDEIDAIKKQWELDYKDAPHLITNSNGIHISELDDLIKQLEEYEKDENK